MLTVGALVHELLLLDAPKHVDGAVPFLSHVHEDGFDGVQGRVVVAVHRECRFFDEGEVGILCDRVGAEDVGAQERV